MPKGQADGSAVLISLIPILIIPQLAISIEQRLSKSPQADVHAAELPRGRATGIGNADAVTQPILNIGAPLECAVDLDIAVVQVRCSHHLADVEETLGQHHLAVGAALLESVEYLGSIIFARVQRRHSAGRAGFVQGCERRDTEDCEEAEVWEMHLGYFVWFGLHNGDGKHELS